MNEYKGSCHCGAIRFTFTGPEIDKGLHCNCSMCRRNGAVMSGFVVAPDEMIIEDKDNCLATYEFGHHVAKHHFCRKCGIYTFHQTLRKPGYYRINLGCVEGVDVFSVPVDVFDGASL